MVMAIDIYNYFDRWAINYIVYHPEHSEDYGDPAAAASHFSSLYQQQVGMLNEIDISGNVINEMRARGGQAAEPLKIAASIEKGEFTDNVLLEIQDLMNRGLDTAAARVTFENYMAIINEASTFNNMLSNSASKANTINDFFVLLSYALDQVNLLSMEVLDILTDIGKHLAGTGFVINYSPQNQVQLVDEADIQTAQKVLDSLIRVVNKMRAAGAVNARSFAQTIRSIFNNIIGGKVQEVMIAEAIAVEGAEAFNQGLAQIAKAVSKGGNKFTYEKLPSKKSYTRFSNSIFNNGVFSMKISKNGKEVTVDIASKLEIQRKSKNKPISIHWAGSSTLNQVVNWSGEEKYLGYNMLGNQYWFGEAANKVKASIAATYLNDAMKGGIIPGSRDSIQLLFVRGKLISVGRLINNICNEIAELGSNDVISFGETSNRWIGGRANLEDALTRSKILNKLIDTLTIAFTFNENILLRYAY